MADTIAPNSKKNNACGVVADTTPPLGEEDQEVLDEAFKERAAIMEYEGGMTREEAEAWAREEADRGPDRE